MQRHNSAAQEAKQKERQVEEAIKRDAYKKVFNTPEGRVILKDIFQKAGMWFTTFTGNSQTYFNEGKRELGLYVLKRVTRADPNIVADMMRTDIDLRYHKEDVKN